MLTGLSHAAGDASRLRGSQALAEILDEFNAARIITVCDETASRDSFLFQVAQPELPDDHSELDLTVGSIGPNIYGDVHR
jgi:hypothetical protein